MSELVCEKERKWESVYVCVTEIERERDLLSLKEHGIPLRCGGVSEGAVQILKAQIRTLK